jgi:hypothetical protein
LVAAFAVDLTLKTGPKLHLQVRKKAKGGLQYFHLFCPENKENPL